MHPGKTQDTLDTEGISDIDETIGSDEDKGNIKNITDKTREGERSKVENFIEVFGFSYSTTSSIAEADAGISPFSFYVDGKVNAMDRQRRLRKERNN